MNGKFGKLFLGSVLCAGLFSAAILSAQTRVAPKRSTEARPAPQARPATPEARRPNDRLDNERARIRRGVQSGELTRTEVARLRKELETAQAHEKRALKDGSLTPQEKERLHNEIERLNREIYKQTHDNQDRD